MNETKNAPSNLFGSVTKKDTRTNKPNTNRKPYNSSNNSIFDSLNNVKKTSNQPMPILNAVKVETPKPAVEILEPKRVNNNKRKPKSNSNKKQRTTFSTEFMNKQRQMPKSPIIDEYIETTNLQQEINIHRATNTLKIMMLGGVGEIGKNMMALEYGNDIIVVDCGSTFPTDELLGIDLVVPDITYLIQNKDKIRGVVLTHGHEDHIGGLPYFLSDIDTTVYGSKLTNALVASKLREHQKIKPSFVTIKANDVIKLGSSFKVEFIKVSHSIAGAMALAITTPAGVMLHTGDFKIDFSPIDGEMTNLARMTELGKQGVLLLTAESTNVERPGYSMSESTVGKTLDGLFNRFIDSRIFVATFASNIHRLQQILELAEKYKRKVVFTGRSMLNVTETAYKIGELKFNKNIIVDIENIKNYQDKELLIITTGSQGEPMAALSRMSSGDFQKIKLGKHDAIIISASPIPGNEKSVNNVINRLYMLGCDVIYHDLAEVHVSGHACREELKTIHALVKPKYFMPVHGEYRHQMLHKNLAMEMGMEEKNILVPELGNRIEVTKNAIKNIGTITSGKRLIDGSGIGDIDSTVLKDRMLLSEEGLCVVVVGISSTKGTISSGPDIITRGLIYSSEMEKMVIEAKSVVVEAVNNSEIMSNDWSIVRMNIRKAVANYFFKKTKRRPMILTVILEN